MGRSNSAESAKAFRRQLKSLQSRVSWLERALKPRRPDAPKVDRARASHERDRAEREAKSKALRKYYEARELEHYREQPSFLRAAIASEQERNAFLVSRGFKPEPSRISTKALTLLPKAARPRAGH